MPPSSVGWRTKYQILALPDTKECELDTEQALRRECFQKLRNRHPCGK